MFGLLGKDSFLDIKSTAHFPNFLDVANVFQINLLYGRGLVNTYGKVLGEKTKLNIK